LIVDIRPAHRRLDDCHSLADIRCQVAHGDRFRHLYSLDDFGGHSNSPPCCDFCFRTAQIRLQRDFATSTLFAIAEFVVPHQRPTAAATRDTVAGAARWRSGLLFGGAPVQRLRGFALESSFVGLLDGAAFAACLFFLALDLGTPTFVSASSLLRVGEFLLRLARRVFAANAFGYTSACDLWVAWYRARDRPIAWSAALRRLTWYGSDFDHDGAALPWPAFEY
jgi:hypothetical protein